MYCYDVHIWLDGSTNIEAHKVTSDLTRKELAISYASQLENFEFFYIDCERDTSIVFPRQSISKIIIKEN